MSPALPSSLQRQFEYLERRLWRMDALVAFTGAAGSLLLSLFFQFASDRLWDTPAWLRALFAVAGWGGFLFFAFQYGSRWIWGRRSLRTLAVIVQRRYRRLGDRLLGIVELADAGARPANFSPELCQAAIEQVAAQASSFDFQDAVATRKPRRYLAWFAALAAMVAALAILTPRAGWNALLRWIYPVSNVARYTFVSLRELPGRLVVAQGEPFDITVGLAADSYWRPARANSRFEGQASVEAPIRDGAATFHLPGQTEPRRLWLSVGDAARAVQIEPEVRPDLRQLRATLELPAYLQYPPQDVRIEAGTLGFLPGTKAVFAGEAVRALGSGELSQGEKRTPLTVNGDRFHTASMLLEMEQTLTFSWKDAAGLAGPAPMVVRLAPKEDAPPEVELRGLEAAIAILPGEVVPIDLTATDDYGVKRLSLQWQLASTGPDVPAGAAHEINIAAGKPQAKTLGGHYDFSPVLLEIPLDATVLVRGEAIDYYPDRAPSATPVYKIHVLSPEAHARLVHDEFEKLMAQLEELTRRQEAILQAGQEVQANKREMARSETGERLGAQARAQNETAAQLRNLADKTTGVLKEALRNPVLSPETLQDWARHAESMRQLAGTQMPAAAQSLASAQSGAGQREAKLGTALSQEKEILDRLRAMEKETNESVERLMAQTLAARLRQAAATEQELAGTFVKMLPDTVGMKPDQLPEEARQTVNGMAAAESGVTTETGHVHEEISRLFDRTSLARYGDVTREMDDLKTEDVLGQLAGWMKGNIAMQSIEAARKWSEQLGKWADRLSDNDQKKSPNGQGSAAGDQAAQMRALLALMRLRQQQEQTREQTSALDGRRETDYPAQAKEISGTQSGLHEKLQALQQDETFPIPADELEPAGKAMGEAATLLAKPETGKPTVSAQTDAINLLDAVIMQHAKKSGASMSALMSMMGVGGGGTGTGSMAGGTANGPNTPVTGNSEGAGLQSRPVPQAVGLDHAQLPPEFRETIESYHRQIEQQQGTP